MSFSVPLLLLLLMLLLMVVTQAGRPLRSPKVPMEYLLQVNTHDMECLVLPKAEWLEPGTLIVDINEDWVVADCERSQTFISAAEDICDLRFALVVALEGDVHRLIILSWVAERDFKGVKVLREGTGKALVGTLFHSSHHLVLGQPKSKGVPEQDVDGVVRMFEPIDREHAFKNKENIIWRDVVSGVTGESYLNLKSFEVLKWYHGASWIEEVRRLTDGIFFLLDANQDHLDIQESVVKLLKLLREWTAKINYIMQKNVIAYEHRQSLVNKTRIWSSSLETFFFDVSRAALDWSERGRILAAEGNRIWREKLIIACDALNLRERFSKIVPKSFHLMGASSIEKCKSEGNVYLSPNHFDPRIKSTILEGFQPLRVVLRAPPPENIIWLREIVAHYFDFDNLQRMLDSGVSDRFFDMGVIIAMVMIVVVAFLRV